MEENGFFIITFDSEVQLTSSFHCCAGFDDIFHMTPIMAIMAQIWGGAKWPKIT